MVRLLPCPGCSRHVRRVEPACPFCGAEVVEPTKRELPRRTWNGPITRAALVLGAVSVGALEACGGGDSAAPGYGVPIHDSPDGGHDALRLPPVRE